MLHAVPLHRLALQVLAKSQRLNTEPTQIAPFLAKADGKDIVKRSNVRKNRCESYHRSKPRQGKHRTLVDVPRAAARSGCRG